MYPIEFGVIPYSRSSEGEFGPWAPEVCPEQRVDPMLMGQASRHGYARGLDRTVGEPNKYSEALPEVDTLWPACDMSRRLRSRAAEEGGSRVTVLAYTHAGHSAFGPRLPEGHPDLSDRWSGGTAAANNEGRAKSWPLVVDFLRTRLASAWC
jgi:hypothetical protein